MQPLLKPVIASVAETDNFHADNPLTNCASCLHALFGSSSAGFAYPEVAMSYVARISIWIKYVLN